MLYSKTLKYILDSGPGSVALFWHFPLCQCLHAAPPEGRLVTSRSDRVKISQLRAGFRIRIFFADPDPGKNLHADPGEGAGGKGKK